MGNLSGEKENDINDFQLEIEHAPQKILDIFFQELFITADLFGQKSLEYS